MSEKLSENYEREIAQERWIILYKEIESLKQRLRFSLPLKIKTLIVDIGTKLIGNALIVWLSFQATQFLYSFTKSSYAMKEITSNWRVAVVEDPSLIEILFAWAGILLIALLILSICAYTLLSIIKTACLLFSKRLALNQIEQKVNELAKLEIEIHLKSQYKDKQNDS
jgi:hypothetical protein